eukprot:sb/3467390/
MVHTKKYKKIQKNRLEPPRGVSVMLLYQHILHPWRHIMATEPLFKHKDKTETGAKFLLGISLSILFAVGDLAALCVVCLESYDKSTVEALVFFGFPYAIIFIALLVFFIGLLTSQNLNGLKILTRPNCAVNGMICLFKVSGIQGAIILGIVKITRSGTSDIDVAMALYLVCQLCGTFVTVVLYQTSDLSNKFEQRGEGGGWNGGGGMLMMDDRRNTLYRSHPPPPHHHHRHEHDGDHHHGHDVGVLLPPALPPKPAVTPRGGQVHRKTGRDTPAFGGGGGGGHHPPHSRGRGGRGRGH